jgi:leader peptidase (prepilin peptidase)/N-methyltransferase
MELDFLTAVAFSPFVFMIGACIGSFLNVVIYRLPANLSLIHPPSRCPHCFHRLGKTENIPIFGWLWLRGKCRWCHTPISPRYPLIEALTGWIFLIVFWKFGLTSFTVGYWIFLSWLLALTFIDLDTFTLPNSLTKWGLILGLLFQAYIGWETGNIPEKLILGIGSAVLGIWFFDIIRYAGTLILGQPAMGGGDPKLAAMIGAWLGWKFLLVTAFLSCAVGALIGGGAIALKLISRRTPIPFGPFLALGAAMAVFWGNALIDFYFKVFFPTF